MSNRKLIDDLRGFECSDAVGHGDFELCQIAADALEKQEWQPIETVPNTEEVVMFGELGKYQPYMARADDHHCGAHWLQGATHWRHLPAPPSTA